MFSSFFQRRNRFGTNTAQGGEYRLIRENNVLNAFHSLQMTFFRLFRQRHTAMYAGFDPGLCGTGRINMKWRIEGGSILIVVSSPSRSCPVVEGDMKGV